jgi:DNA-binding NarL/FixJ family response regulator
MKSKIFIVDDHPVFRQGLAQLINHEDDMVSAGEAADAKEALPGIEKAKPDLVIVDISLKEVGGITLTKEILSKHPKMLVLIISMYDESIYVDRVLRAGAKGYIMKQEATDHVITAIRTVLRGELYVSDKWRDTLVSQYAGRGKPADGVPAERLTDREMEVLQLIGKGHSTQKIAEELHVSGKTIDSHYANIKTKLNLKNAHELIQYAVTWCLSEK